MLTQTLSTYANFCGQWFNAYQAALPSYSRVVCGQIELVSESTRFLANRFYAYSDYDGDPEPLVGKLDVLTNRYTEDYARCLKNIYAAWAELLRQDQAIDQRPPATGHMREEPKATRQAARPRERAMAETEAAEAEAA